MAGSYENSDQIKKLADLIYKIYVQTSQDRKISERNCQISQKILTDHRTENYSNIESTPPPKIHKCTCRLRNIVQTTEAELAEKQIVENIDTALEKAKSIRIQPIQKYASPYLVSQLKPAKPMKQKTIKSQPMFPAKNKMNGSSIELKNGKAEKHAINCAINKNKAVKQKLEVISVTSLGNIRLPGEIQKALKWYYKIVREGVTCNPSLPKAKNAFLTKLGEHNEQKWDRRQKLNYSMMFELGVYINTYKPIMMSWNSGTSLCRFYNNVDVLIGLQQSLNQKDKMDYFSQIFDYINTDFFNYLNCGQWDLTLIPLVFKCYMNFINIYNTGNFLNIAVIKK